MNLFKKSLILIVLPGEEKKTYLGNFISNLNQWFDELQYSTDRCC